MNWSNGSNRIDVVVQTESAEWWQIVTALTPLAALLFLVCVVFIVPYKDRRPDRRRGHAAGPAVHADWWSRAEWAMDMALDDKPERRNIGLAVLEQLSSDHSLGEEDSQIVAQARALLKRH